MNKTAAFPREFNPEDETDLFLRKYKMSLSKRLTLSKMKELFEETDLAYYLVALDRKQEALAVTSFLSSNVSFSGNYNIWSPVGYSICLQIRLYRLSGNFELSSKGLSLLRMYPVYVIQEDKIEEKLDQLRFQLNRDFLQQSPKWACQSLARILYKLCYFREVHADSLRDFNPLGLSEVENLVVDGFRKLRFRLDIGP